MIKKNPYQTSPVIETGNFIFRLVEEDDSADLLECYSDKKAVKFFNKDNCNTDFYYKTKEEMLETIKFWLLEYSHGMYVRLSVVNKFSQKAIGTIEIFAKEGIYERYGKIGFLRIDLASDYESKKYILEITEMALTNFSEMFEINSLMTKAVPEAEIRIEVLREHGFIALQDKKITEYDDHYIREIDSF